MSSLILIVAMVGFAVMLLVLLRIGLLPQRRVNPLHAMPTTGPDRALAERILSTVRARNLTATAVAVFGFVVALVIHQAFIKPGALALVAAPAGIWVLVVLVLVCWPIPSEFPDQQGVGNSPVAATLVPRTTGMFGPRWGLVVPIVLFVVTMIGLVVAGLLSSTDELGRHRQIGYQTVSGAVLDDNMVVTGNLVGDGSTGPFPGWYYGVPVGILLVLGLALTLVALSGNARRPSLRSQGLSDFDLAVRTHNGYILSSGFSAFICLQLVPLLTMAATSVYNMSYSSVYAVGQKVDDSSTGELVLDPWKVALAWSLGSLGMLLLIVGIVLLGYLLAWVVAAYGLGSQNRNTRNGVSV